MLIQRIIFGVLGAALYLCAFAFGDDDIVQINGTAGEPVDFEMPFPTGVTRCMVTSNAGLLFTLFPNTSERPDGITQGYNHAAAGNCGMRIESATVAHGGVWTIEAYMQWSEDEPLLVARFLLQVEEGDSEGEIEPHIEGSTSVDVFPSRTISVFAEHTMSLRLRNYYENLTSCIATLPDGEEFDVLNTDNNLSNVLSPFDQCGVTVRVNSNHTGTWRLDAMIRNNEDEILNYYGYFYVMVQDSSIVDTEWTVTHLQRGAPASINLGPSNAVSCRLKNPRGQYLPVQSGSCRIDIPTVTYWHEGFWTASYSLNGRLNAVEQLTEVYTYDDNSLNATVTSKHSGEYDLLCSVRAYSFSFCQFVRPDSTVLNIFEGIGNDRYLYHGNGTQSTSMLTERNHECGITILKPETSDFGAWKCILGTSSGLTGSILNVPDIRYSGYENVVTSYEETVWVVKGKSFTVKCNANVALTYCWMRSPNGTAYSVSTTEISPTTLQYEGMGLSFGECGAVIPAAEDTDEGEWHCGMGISTGAEVRSVVHAVVTDTLLMQDVRSVTIRNNQAELSCSLIPGAEESIDYCRWIKPSGIGIKGSSIYDYSEHYYTPYHTTGSCQLKIENVKWFGEIGEWTCIAGLTGSSVEVSATIQLLEDPISTYSNSAVKSWCFGLGIGLISVIVAAVFVIIIRSKFQNKDKPDLPPQYEETEAGSPPLPTLHTQP